MGSVAGLDCEQDWILPYYRDMGVVLAWGMSLKDVFLAQFAKADDPTSGGRRLPNHWSDPKMRIFTQSSPVGSQYLHACGIAHGLVLRDRPGVVAVYGGDGSTSQGDFYEALNWAAVFRLPVIFIIENNGYAISVSTEEAIAGSIYKRADGYGIRGVLVGGNDPEAVREVVAEAAEVARLGIGPTLIEATTYRFFAHSSDDDDRLYRTEEEVDKYKEQDPLLILEQRLVEESRAQGLAIQQLKESCEASVRDAVLAAEAASSPSDPTRYVYARSEDDPYEIAETATDSAGGPEESVNLVTAVNRALHDILGSVDEALVFGEDVGGDKGGVFKATVGLSEAYGRERCFNTPLAESAIVGVSIGMSAAGLRPIPEIQFADYIHPAFDQIVSEAARIHYRSNGTWTCPITIRTPYGGGISGALYHSQSVEAFYAHVPGLKVVTPSRPEDVFGLLQASVMDPNPVLFLEPKKLYRLAKGTYSRSTVPLGSAFRRSAGDDVTILTYGAMAHFASDADVELRAAGINADIIDLRTLKPVDWTTIESSIKKTSRLMVVHEDNEFCGYGAELVAWVAERLFMWLDAPPMRLCLPDVPAFPYSGDLERTLYLDAQRIVDAATTLSRW